MSFNSFNSRNAFILECKASVKLSLELFNSIDFSSCAVRISSNSRNAFILEFKTTFKATFCSFFSSSSFFCKFICKFICLSYFSSCLLASFNTFSRSSLAIDILVFNSSNSFLNSTSLPCA